MNALSPRGEAARLRLMLIGSSVGAVEAKPVAGTLPTHSHNITFHHTFKNPPPLDILANQLGISRGGLIKRPV